MKIVALAVAAVVMGSGMLWAQSEEQKKAEAYIIESERQWADSVATGKTDDVARILAEDFIGVDPEGKQYDKKTMVDGTKDAPKEYVSNRLNDVKVRFYGDTAVAQGSESWERRTGTPKYGRFVWTDTWVKRNGKWQIVAAEDLTVEEKR